jgi:acyl carrier protein
MSTDVQIIVSEVFHEVLGIEDIEPSTSFVDLGGVSLEAEQIAARLSETLNIRLTAADVMARETLREVGKLVAERLGIQTEQGSVS